MKKNIIFLILAFLAILVIFAFAGRQDTDNLKTIKVNGVKISVEIAQTPQTRAKGLSGRESLPENQGVLFVFETPDRYSFWMKEMNFALDFLWINGDKIVETTENVKPEDFQPPKTLNAQSPVDTVLELNAGSAQRLNIKPGDKIEF